MPNDWWWLLVAEMLIGIVFVWPAFMLLAAWVLHLQDWDSAPDLAWWQWFLVGLVTFVFSLFWPVVMVLWALSIPVLLIWAMAGDD